MRHYITNKSILTIGKEGNENYVNQITLFGKYHELFEKGAIGKETVIKLHNDLRAFIGAENFISIVNTVEENVFEIYHFDLKADERILKPIYDEELKNYYIEVEGENELH